MMNDNPADGLPMIPLMDSDVSVADDGSVDGLPQVVI
jgi:hypothetical protein